jgi:hypothetical protein
MTASDSLQTGNATRPRIIVQKGSDSKLVFGFALDSNELEYMQFDETEKRNQFRFFLIHNKVVDENANASADAKRCSNCHFGTRMAGWPYPRPNWDAYDSWGGALPYNRDRIYESSTEETALKELLKNLKDDPIVSQLDLPPGITRECNGDVVITYPGGNFIDSGIAGRMTAVKFTNAVPPTYPGTASVNVTQGRRYLTMNSTSADRLAVDEGRGVALFDHLTLLNARRVAQEIIDAYAARGNTLDLRPSAFGVASGCATAANLRDYAPDDALKQFLGVADPANFPAAFTTIVNNTETARHELPKMKADQQAVNVRQLMIAYGGAQTGAGITQEVARRSLFGQPSLTAPAEFRKDTLTEFMIDRERYNAQEGSSTRISLFRLYLQTAGVPVRRWTMSIRGEGENHSNTYTFGDLFIGIYIRELTALLGEEDALKADGTAFGKKFKDLTCPEVAQLSKAWIDRAFAANPGSFGPP